LFDLCARQSFSTTSLQVFKAGGLTKHEARILGRECNSEFWHSYSGPPDSNQLVKVHLELLQPFNGLFSRTTWVSRYQKGKTSLDLNEARWWSLGIEWHQLNHMQIICTSLQTDNYTNTSSLTFYRLGALPDAQRTVSKHGHTTLKAPVLVRSPELNRFIWKMAINIRTMSDNNDVCIKWFTLRLTVCWRWSPSRPLYPIWQSRCVEWTYDQCRDAMPIPVPPQPLHGRRGQRHAHSHPPATARVWFALLAEEKPADICQNTIAPSSVTNLQSRFYCETGSDTSW